MDWETLQIAVDNYMLGFQKVLPCVVIGVNHSACTCDVQPLVKTRYEDRQEYYAPYYDVPFMVYSSFRGDVQITIPLAVGDNVVVLFSDRDTSGLINSDGLSSTDSASFVLNGPYPIMAIPCFYTRSAAKPISSEDIVIRNKTTSITVKPDGTVNVVANSKTYIDTPLAEITGDCLVKKNLHVNGNFTVDGYSRGHGSLEIDGTITSHSDVISNVSLNNHTHTCPDGETSGPH